MRHRLKILLAIPVVFLIGVILQTGIISHAQTTKSILGGNKYISFSPDGNAFTVGYGDKGTEMHDYSYMGHILLQNGFMEVAKLGPGEHYYNGIVEGAVPVAYWKISHTNAKCIHSNSSCMPEIYGLSKIGANIRNCWREYHVGWIPYCAYCGKEIISVYMYMSEDMASSIKELPSGMKGSNYYYLCPYDNSLENQGAINHECILTSCNKYNVRYNPGSDEALGQMGIDTFMYGNAKKYEGKEVKASECLSECRYERLGYVFAGWSATQSGEVEFADKEDWINVQDSQNVASLDNNSIIDLYAIWKPMHSILEVDYAGGEVDGNYGPADFTREYGTSMELRKPNLSPYKVSFDFQGGYTSIELGQYMVAERTFEEWIPKYPLKGLFDGNTYFFLSEDKDSVDHIRAAYTVESIELPMPRKDGYSFEGWYLKGDYVGTGGTRYTPRGDELLTAKWSPVLLSLSSYPDYSKQVNGGKGAVDLSWQSSEYRPDLVYRIYDSSDGNTWSCIGEEKSVEDITEYSATFLVGENKYIVPADGLYRAEIYGASGGDFSYNHGGLGGKVSLTLLLKAGQELSFNVGGKGTSFSGFNIWGNQIQQRHDGGNGMVDNNAKLYCAGGAGFGGAGGGGATCMYITSQGEAPNLIAVAGGGGGAGIGMDGLPGGSSSNVCESGTIREVQQIYSVAMGTTEMTYYSVGGGGGYMYGKPGVMVAQRHVHKRDSSICAYHEHWGDATSGEGCYCIPHVEFEEKNYDITCYSTNGTGSYVCENIGCGRVGTISGMNLYGWFDGYWHQTGWSGYLNCPRCGDDYGRLHSDGQMDGVHSEESSVTTYEIGCGKEEGYNCTSDIPLINQFLLDRGDKAGGGSNWVSAARSNDYKILNSEYNQKKMFGVNEGDGYALVTCLISNCTTKTNMDNVPATDYGKPNAVYGYKIDQSGEDSVRVSWKKPADTGTEYFYKAESYSIYSGNMIALSNISRQILTTGISGYLYTETATPKTVIGAEEAKYTDKALVDISLHPGEKKYLNVAAIDNAGNIGNTINIPIDAGDPSIVMLWDIKTKSLSIDEGDNVYKKGEKEYYMRADGKTPIILNLEAYMDGNARETYQINEAMFLEDGENGAFYSVYANNTFLPVGDITLSERELSFYSAGVSKLINYPYTKAIRKEGGRSMVVSQGFVASKEKNGESVLVIPRASATETRVVDGQVLSKYGEDVNKAINLIFDGEAPKISGIDEFLSNKIFIDKSWQGELPVLIIKGEDSGSGVNSNKFYVTLQNFDNGCSYTWNSEGGSEIRVTFDEYVFDQIFYLGNFSITVYAEDMVGNIAEEKINGYGFDMTTSIERLLEKLDGKTVFARGESGDLNISTFGYVDYVEVIFPEELSYYNCVYNYQDDPDYRKDEVLRFMIPISGMPDGDQSFEITVIAHKNGESVVNHPRVNVINISGNVLDELRTTLR